MSGSQLVTTLCSNPQSSEIFITGKDMPHPLIMNKIIFSLAIWISLFSTDIFSQESLIPLCANNLQTIQSYHTEIYFRDLLDKKTKDGIFQRV